MKKKLSYIKLPAICVFIVISAVTFHGETAVGQNQVSLNYGMNDTTIDEYNYPNKEWWYAETKSANFWKKDGVPFKNAYDFVDWLGNVDRGWNMEAFVNSELGKNALNTMLHWIKYPDEMSKEVVDFWAEMSIKKEMHNASDPENKWASYMPLSIYKPENKGRRYPLLFVFRGGNDPIYAAESFGFIRYSLKAGYITVIPYNRSPEAIQKLLVEIKNKYPVDASRIYITGNGRGAWMSCGNAIAYPKTFAAIGPFGVRPVIDIRDPIYTKEEVAAQVEAAKAVKIPIMVIDGQYDTHRHFPLNLSSSADRQLKIDELNTWFKINNIVVDPLTLGVSEGLMLNSNEWIERQTGIDFPVIWDEQREGTNYAFGEFYDSGGMNLMRFTMVENGNHWYTASYPEIIWNYLKQFSRDPETGKLIWSRTDVIPSRSNLK